MSNFKIPSTMSNVNTFGLLVEACRKNMNATPKPSPEVMELYGILSAVAARCERLEDMLARKEREG